MTEAVTLTRIIVDTTSSATAKYSITEGRNMTESAASSRIVLDTTSTTDSLNAGNATETTEAALSGSETIGPSTAGITTDTLPGLSTTYTQHVNEIEAPLFSETTSTAADATPTVVQVEEAGYGTIGANVFVIGALGLLLLTLLAIFMLRIRHHRAEHRALKAMDTDDSNHSETEPETFDDARTSTLTNNAMMCYDLDIPDTLRYYNTPKTTAAKPYKQDSNYEHMAPATPKIIRNTTELTKLAIPEPEYTIMVSGTPKTPRPHSFNNCVKPNSDYVDMTPRPHSYLSTPKFHGKFDDVTKSSKTSEPRYVTMGVKAKAEETYVDMTPKAGTIRAVAPTYVNIQEERGGDNLTHVSMTPNVVLNFPGREDAYTMAIHV